MNIFQTVILAVVEGLTEFLPVSSTGHLILAGHFLNIPETPEAKLFDVAVQAGPMVAVVVYYWRDFLAMIRGLMRPQSENFLHVKFLFYAFLPAAIIGLMVRKTIKAHLFGTGPVVGALIVGGIAMIVCERYLRAKKVPEHLGPRDSGEAVKIGFFQCLAMWPGTSRSMCTILGARLCGIERVSAAKFSFFLAVPTLLGATLVDFLKTRKEIVSYSSEFLLNLAVGNIISFLVALVVIHSFLAFLRKYSLDAFGYYRIVAGIILLLVL